MAKSFRMDTSGKYAYRDELLEATAERLGESTKAGGVVAACEFARRMETNLERAAREGLLDEELADVLSTPEVPIEYEVAVQIGRDD